jgi:hypothetical protein
VNKIKKYCKSSGFTFFFRETAIFRSTEITLEIHSLGREVINITNTTAKNFRKQACIATAGESICQILEDGTG